MPGHLAEKLSDEEVQETAMVDLAFHILKEKGEPILYRNLMEAVSGLKGFSEEEEKEYMAQLYTEVNIDGRFICVGKSLWGLRRWYPTEQATDSAVAQNVKDDDSAEELEAEELYEEGDGDSPEDFDEDFENDGDYDAVDEEDRT
ncbi:DNA-directed RNA polymerase subunit delta [Paludifilum halophilum]|uniref:RNAP delta factor n=1 Tax=Paludifilum halophilum TaxID=1642702 RepID=A0A235B6X6_9BACL|nr:DNA-directed RNA polymerase subunit delta [Paludifilum halophilum]OYD07982.1 DNA-directed RNA polymerase subunit delta [Paludifilum halophilum]